jgi:hypothetical protein
MAMNDEVITTRLIPGLRSFVSMNRQGGQAGSKGHGTPRSHPPP